jgi:actin-related protein 8
MLNTDAYTSVQQIRGDLALIWTDSIVKQLQIRRRDFPKYRVLLIVPDLLPRNVVEDVFMNALLRDCGFASVLVQTEAVCACYGAGLSSATVVDIGDTCTKISCVDDGVVLPISRINLKYGMADVRTLLFHQLKRHSLPYKDIDTCPPWTQKLMQDLGDTMLSLSEVIFHSISSVQSGTCRDGMIRFLI